MCPSSTAAFPVAAIHGLSFGLGPDREHRPSSRSEHPGDLARSTIHLRDEHETESAQNRVDRVVGESEPRRILHGELDVVEPELVGTAPRHVDHLGRRVGREQDAAGLKPWMEEESGLARAGCELEDAHTGLGRKQLDHPGGEQSCRARERLTSPLPSGCDATPRGDLLRRDLVYAATPLKEGMMCLPYAASVSSWPCVIR